MQSEILSRVLEISRHMAQMRNLDPLLEYVMREAIDIAGAERGYIVLIDQDGTPEFKVIHDTDGEVGASDQISTSILNRVLETGAPLVIGDALADPDFNNRRSVIELRLRSVMCVPLITGGQVIGVVYVENRSATGIFVEDDLQPLTIFGNQAAVAIENAILNDELEARVAARTADLQQALEELETDWQEAEESLRLRSLVMGGVAHDVRAPLVVATTALSMVGDGSFGPINQNQRLWIKKSMIALNHAMELIQDVFDLARIEMGQFNYDPEYVDLEHELRNIYEVAAGLPWEDNVEFTLELDPALPDILLDPYHIKRVLFNLTSNALKYTHEGTVTMYAYPAESEVIIGVRDTGEGIEEDQLSRLFDRFHQADNKAERRRKGIGLGLALCKQIVEMHGGRIWVESAPEIGSNFAFALPVRSLELDE